MAQQRVSEARFLASQTATVSGGGFSAVILAGEEYVIPRAAFDDAIDKGMTPLEELNIQSVEEKGIDRRTQDEKLEILVEACEKLIIRGNAKDFTQLLKPKVAVVREMVDFEFTKALLLRAYEQAIYRSEQKTEDGEDSTADSGHSIGPSTE